MLEYPESPMVYTQATDNEAELEGIYEDTGN
jgi:hypothetical protein